VVRPHVLFDGGAFSIADDFSLLGLGGKLTTVPEPRIDPGCLAYHRTHVWKRPAN
jgi:putative restriction endonuclease